MLIDKIPSNNQLKIVSTFRPRVAQRYLSLHEITLEKSNFRLDISLPLNEDTEAHQRILSYPELKKHIGQDVREIGKRYRFISGVGRLLPLDNPEMENIVPDIIGDSTHYGSCKIFINPDGMWLQLYLPASHSHTTRGYIHIKDTDMLKKLSIVMPYNVDFALPPNWPAGNSRATIVADAYPFRYYKKADALNPIYFDSNYQDPEF
jgi:hypothetical protein